MGDLNLDGLFDNAADDGIIDGDSQTILSGSMDPVMVAGAAGIDAENIEASNVTLVTILIDKSGSIRHYNAEDAIRDGFNELVKALRDSKQADEILLSVWLFNEDQNVMHSFVPLNDVVTLDGQNYRPAGMTSLYNTYVKALGANVAYAQDLRDNGTPTRSVVVLMTDGEDTVGASSSGQCNTITRNLLTSETLIVGFVGVGDDAHFTDIAKSMGIPDGCVRVEKNTDAHSVRELFNVISQSVIKASQGQIDPGANAGFFAN